MQRTSDDQKALSLKDYISSADNDRLHLESINTLKETAREHWARFRPKMFQRLTNAGILEDLLETAVEFTNEELRELQRQLMNKGYPAAIARQKAWERLQGKWILLPKEK